MNRLIQVVIALAMAALSLLTASGCGPRSEASTALATAKAVLARASLVKPERRDVPVVIEQPGQIEAYEQTPIYAKIAGYVAEVCVDMNAQVAKGQCLAKLHVPEMEDQLKQKHAAVAQARAELEQARRTLHSAEAAIRAATARLAEVQAGHKRALASRERFDSEHQRIERLVERQVIDRQTLDEVKNQAQAAAANLDEAQARIRSAEASCDESSACRDKILADIVVAQSRLDVAHSDAQYMRTLLQYAVLQAPFAGIVTRRHVHTGHLLKPGEGANREPLFVLARTDPVRIFVDVPEAEAARVRPGVPARVRIQALNDREIEAQVARTSWALDPANRTLRAEIELPNPAGELRPGMYAYAAIHLEHPETWTVPAALVQRSEEAAVGFLLQEGKASRTSLRLGARDGARIEVLKKRAAGASRWLNLDGDECFLQGADGPLQDGQNVEIAAQKN